MGLFSEKFEKEEKQFVKELTENGVSFQKIALIRGKYDLNFKSNREVFDSFKNEVLKETRKPER